MSLAIEEAGSGIPLVFLHAFPLDRRMWVPQSSFSRNYHVITLDFPGFGGTPISAPISTMEWMAREVISTLDGASVKQPAIFAGLSMGGYVLLQIARLFPERLRAAVFAATKASADSTEAREKRFTNVALVEKDGVPALVSRMNDVLLGETTRRERPQVVATVKDIAESQTPHAVIAALRGLAERPDTHDVLDSLQVPALFLAGAEDAIIKPAEMEAMSQRVKKKEFHVIEKAGHLLNLERPDEFENLISHFLKRRVL